MESTALFAPLEPYITHQLEVGDGHTLYVEECGNPKGKPVLVLHGGPGSGCTPDHRRRFDPSVWRIVCFDQRGCGRSTAPAEGTLHANTTQHMVADNEKIRQHLGIETWALLYGSSWGSTLALAYAQAFTQRVKALVIGGIFLADEESLGWFYEPMGLRQFLPNEFAAVQAFAPNVHGHALIQAIASQGGKAVKALVYYESLASELAPDRAALEAYLSSPATERGAMLEIHYFANRCFLTEGQLLRDVPKIAHLPIHILNGLQDMVCPPAGAHRLYEALRAAGGNPTLTLVPACGHRGTEGMEAARVNAIQALEKRIF